MDYHQQQHDRPMTLREIGKVFGVNAERVRQIEAKAMRRLRHPSRSRKLLPLVEPERIEPWRWCCGRVRSTPTLEQYDNGWAWKPRKSEALRGFAKDNA